MGNAPIEPNADARRAAKSLHQMFTALMQEGFTEKQALVIIGQMLAASMKGTEDG